MGPQCPLVPPPMSNSAVLRGKVSRCKIATEFPRKCGCCVKIERQNFLGKIVAATEFPSYTISCDTGRTIQNIIYNYIYIIIESLDSISRDERDTPFTQYIANTGITRARYTITHFKHHHRVVLMISNRIFL